MKYDWNDFVIVTSNIETLSWIAFRSEIGDFIARDERNADFPTLSPEIGVNWSEFASAGIRIRLYSIPESCEFYGRIPVLTSTGDLAARLHGDLFDFCNKVLVTDVFPPPHIACLAKAILKVERYVHGTGDRKLVEYKLTRID